MYQIKEEDYPLKPRERLVILGSEKLNEQELLAILLRTGSKRENVHELAYRVLNTFHSLEAFRRASLSELKAIPGIGPVKAVEIRAMVELGKRIHTTERKRYGQVVGTQQFGLSLAAEMSDLDQENLVAIYLDGQNNIIQKRTIFIGAVNHSIAHPREILHHAVRNLAVGMIIAHNHPSGLTRPSQQDKLFTHKIREACENLGIHLLDHIITGHDSYLSFREQGLL
ncbi:RadC family protein [Lactococcus garvieae]|uniref:DNA repair protein RadC n=1 Tax=Lactococcus garvieae DCC43 TaxID=1231377 RepID=K2QAN0_9LACT|nr:DNA repair protein RadC [Lactococcus garvieae]EKF50547.1 DNA repair protein RadC [Lactococcus garvieae DCC43]QPS71830.1 DNA repair protein RadC [Lactococcus garvieae]